MDGKIQSWDPSSEFMEVHFFFDFGIQNPKLSPGLRLVDQKTLWNCKGNIVGEVVFSQNP